MPLPGAASPTGSRASWRAAKRSAGATASAEGRRASLARQARLVSAARVAGRGGMRFSDDQAEAYDRLAEVFADVGVDLARGSLALPGKGAGPRVLAVTGKAGSGKTALLAELVRALRAAGVQTVSGDWEGRRQRERRSLAVLAPTNKAASVLRNRGVPATTIHRILYTPVYAPEYEAIAEWLAEGGTRPAVEGLPGTALDRAAAFYAQVPSIPGALAAAGLRGSDFIKGW
ncbi:MAG: ATPase, partial [Alphaproteobacteria bacterium HGW-Alphaproteobacteria-2]